jgi:predicted small integral membrane protein
MCLMMQKKQVTCTVNMRGGMARIAAARGSDVLVSIASAKMERAFSQPTTEGGEEEE